MDEDVVDNVILALEKDEKFTARKKKTGNISAFASKETRDNAIKTGEYEKVDSDDKGVAKIKKHKLQIELSFDDFNDCDSGYCGL